EYKILHLQSNKVSMMIGRFLNFFANPTPKQWSFLSLRYQKFQSHPFMSVSSSVDNLSAGKITAAGNKFKYAVNTLHTSSSVEHSEMQEVEDCMWMKMQEEAKVDVTVEPILYGYYNVSIFSHKSLETALANLLAVKLSSAFWHVKLIGWLITYGQMEGRFWLL
ncbi:hypothetical protein KIW84_020207, partial [Lathyrus oleraceus]